MGKVFFRASVWQAGTIYLNLLQKKRVVKPDILFHVIKLWFVNRSFDFQDPMSVRCQPPSLTLLSERNCCLDGLEAGSMKPFYRKGRRKAQIEIAHPIWLSHNTITSKPSKDCRWSALISHRWRKWRELTRSRWWSVQQQVQNKAVSTLCNQILQPRVDLDCQDQNEYKRDVSFWRFLISLILMWWWGGVLRKAKHPLAETAVRTHPQIWGLASASVNDIVNLNHSFKVQTRNISDPSWAVRPKWLLGHCQKTRALRWTDSMWGSHGLYATDHQTR